MINNVIKKHGSIIFSTMASVGVVGTAVLAVKNTDSARIRLEEVEHSEELGKKEKIKIVLPSYILTILTGGVTIGCIYGSHAINQKSIAAITATYMALGQAYDNYKAGVQSYLEEIGADKLDAANERIEELSKENKKLISEDNEKKWFYEAYSDILFEATEKEVLEAEYEINRLIALEGGASLKDFLSCLNLESQMPKRCENYSWDSTYLIEGFDTPWVDVRHTTLNGDARTSNLDFNDGKNTTAIEFLIPLKDEETDAPVGTGWIPIADECYRIREKN